jgi:hypothetical protein
MIDDDQLMDFEESKSLINNEKPNNLQHADSSDQDDNEYDDDDENNAFKTMVKTP